MSEIKLREYDETPVIPKVMISDRLPELEEEAIKDASQQDSIEWAQGMLSHYDVGDLHEMPKYGITMQIISEDTARCISVYDHGYCMFMLHMVITTFKQAGLTLEVDPHTVLRPYEASDEQGPEASDEQGPENEVPQTTIDEAFAIEVV